MWSSRTRRCAGAAALALCLLGADRPLELRALDGEPVVLVPGRERALVVHFWATWCPSCLEELGGLDAAARRCAAAGVRIAAVNVGDPVEEIRRYLARHPLGLELLRDPEGEVWRRLAGQGLPANATWREGERRVEVGPRSAEAWQAELARLGCDAAAGGGS